MMLDLTDPFFLKILASSLFLGVLAGPFGCLVLWQRMAVMGDMLSHASILAILLAHFLNLPLLMVYLSFSGLLGFFFYKLRLQKYPPEQLMMALSYAALSVGIILMSVFGSPQIKFHQILFGDLLAISGRDMFWMVGGGLFLLTHFLALWRPLLLMTFHQELAQIEGIPVSFLKAILTMLLGGVIAISIKIAGALLIIGLLIIPSLTSSKISQTPEEMVIKSSLFGFLSALLGTLSSFFADLPLGPSIITSSFMIFIVVLRFGKE